MIVVLSHYDWGEGYDPVETDTPCQPPPGLSFIKESRFPLSQVSSVVL